MENPFVSIINISDVVRNKLIGKNKGDFISFNYQELKVNYFGLRPAIQQVCRRDFNGLKVKTKHNKDKTELWVTIV